MHSCQRLPLCSEEPSAPAQATKFSEEILPKTVGLHPEKSEIICRVGGWCIPQVCGAPVPGRLAEFRRRPAFTLRGTVNVGVFEGPESVQHRRPTPPRGPLHLTRAGGERGYLYRPKMLEQRTPARLPARSHRARDGVQSQPRGRWDA